MAISAQFQTWIYGMVEGGPPYRGSDPFARQITFPSQVRMNFPSAGVVVHPTSQGVRFGSNYVYSVIEIPASGLNQPSQKYASGDSQATIATNAG